MHSSRLFEIVYLLLDQRKVTARDLAERFEVSVRTIYRDIDALSVAGIPVCTEKGRGGGISLMDGFVLQNSLLSDEERDRIMMGLQTLRAAQYPETDEVLSKLGGIFGQKDTGWIKVDFSGWGTSERETFQLLKEAVLKKLTISFDYFGANAEKARRFVEPLRLLYRGKAWYVQGYCRARGYRIFRVSRIKNAVATGETFQRERSELPEESEKDAAANCTQITLYVNEKLAYRVYDEFDEQDVERAEDGFVVRMCMPVDEWVYGYILSFGPFARVLEPQTVREAVVKRIEEMMKNYENMTRDGM